jgi:hypothetical protein
MPPSVIGVDVLDDETLVVAEDGCELDVGVLVVGELVAGAVGFGALGRPLPCALALTASAMTRPVARAAARGKERFVTMAVPLDGRSKGKGPIN